MRKIILLVLAISCYGCASSLKVKGLPKWYENPPNADAEYLYAAATADSRDMELATEKAKTLIRTGLAQQMAVKVNNLVKQFREDVGEDADTELLEQFTSVTKTVTSETLHGATEEEKEIHQLENGTFRVFVLMSLPIGEANAALMAKIQANKNLYTRFRASQAFEELDKEIKAYEEKQGVQ